MVSPLPHWAALEAQAKGYVLLNCYTATRAASGNKEAKLGKFMMSQNKRQRLLLPSPVPKACANVPWRPKKLQSPRQR